MYTGSSRTFSRFYKIVAVLFVIVIVILLSLGPKVTFLPESYISNRPKLSSQTGAHLNHVYRNITASPTVIERQHTAESGNQVSVRQHTAESGNQVIERQHTAESGNQVIERQHTAESGNQVIERQHTAESGNQVIERQHTAESGNQVSVRQHTAESGNQVIVRQHTAESGNQVIERQHTAESGNQVIERQHTAESGNQVIVRQHTAESGNQVPKKVKSYDFVINSYMRSGSSFTGQLLAFHPDTFYWYEPLWNYHSGVYYWGKDKVCSGRGMCSGSGALNVNRMHEALNMIYECNFQGLVPAVAEKMTPSYSGKVWTPYIQCRSTGGNVATCLANMEEVCRLAKHKATKIVRLTLDNLEYVLENHPKVKVVHLLRDPRAIINSRITTTWYTLSETPHDNHRAIRMDAKDLCSRMAYDIQAAIQLKQKYPDRFALVMYEDLQTDLKRKAEMLYDYFGLDKTPLKEKLENMTDILPDEHLEHIKMGNHTNWWKFRLLFTSVKAVDDVCKTVCDMVGYRIFTDEEQMKNNLTSAFSFDPQLLLENIDKTYRYDFKIS